MNMIDFAKYFAYTIIAKGSPWAKGEPLSLYFL